MILLDTNVLIYATDRLSPQHLPSRGVVDASIARRIEGVIVPQVLVEFVAAATGKAVRSPLSVEQACAQAATFGSQIKMLVPSAESVTEWMSILLETGRAGRRTFDAYLAAQARSLGAATICTYNLDDFNGVSGIRLLRPEDIPILGEPS